MKNLETELGVSLTDFVWEDLAACKGLGLPAGDEEFIPERDDWFFDAYESNEQIAKAADDICMSCPVQKICYDMGVKYKQEGLRGGVYLNAQGKPDPVRNNHKTKETWRKIRRVLNSGNGEKLRGSNVE